MKPEDRIKILLSTLQRNGPLGWYALTTTLNAHGDPAQDIFDLMQSMEGRSLVRREGQDWALTSEGMHFLAPVAQSAAVA